MKEDLKSSALFVTSLASFVNPFMGSSINVVLPSIGKYFNLNAVLLSWIGLSFLLSSSIFLVPFGRLADIYGRKKLFILGTFIYGVSSLFCGISNLPYLLILFRFFQGLGGALFFGTSIALLTSIYPQEERGKALGINASMVYLGLSLGPFLGGAIAEHLGWRDLFILNFFLTIFLSIITSIKLKGEWADAKAEKYDLFGALILIFSFLFMQLGLSFLNKKGYILLILFIAFFYLFVLYEKKQNFPLFNIELFKNSLFLFSNLSAFINYSSTFSCGFMLSLYLQYLKGFSPFKTGIILFIQPIIMAISSPFIGKLSDKKEPRILSSLGMFLNLFSLILLYNLNLNTKNYYIYLILLLLGLGNGFFASPNTNAIMGSVEKKYYGVATGTLSSMRAMGMSTSISLTTLILSIFLKNNPIKIENFNLFISSIKTFSILFSFFLFIGIFTSFSRGKLHNFD